MFFKILVISYELELDVFLKYQLPHSFPQIFGQWNCQEGTSMTLSLAEDEFQDSSLETTIQYHQNIWSKSLRIERIDIYFYNNREFKIPLSIMNKAIRYNINRELEQHNKPTRSNRDTQRTLSNNNNVNILLKWTWNIFQERSYVRPQFKSQ